MYLWGIEFGLPEKDSADAEWDTDWIAASRVEFHSWGVNATDSLSRPTSELIGKLQFEFVAVSQLHERMGSPAALPLRADNNHCTLSFVVCHDSPGVLLI